MSFFPDEQPFNKMGINAPTIKIDVRLLSIIMILFMILTEKYIAKKTLATRIILLSSAP
ncbi:hypothetical protein HMPREF1567_0158 [Providencia alcalifaciens PAL-2]|nr:hypothetical protein HMPREF1562_2305 [Providencia alcalifaciens F90-2004]EUC97175.1 hypothetical protein HMPREF1567_0158 [Providencia alcalifaciens PAL-2]